ncbi:macrophage mannose receptor 1-like isoform X2 [Cynoglossus semilaevis]|uniref:macrophage mannose receptor 1-like isoform X2 n=1 Tax=Cynoglossus semilaevis TaxID=244447 RepID=UPI000D629952|nr:macrophage mannose receptor 1-like isoform X2 [Cynoglossus semilaevis]
MKTILLLTVLFSVVLSIMAAAVPVEAEPAPVEVGEEKLVEEPEVFVEEMNLPPGEEAEPVEPEMEEPEVEEEMGLLPEGGSYPTSTEWKRYNNSCYRFGSYSRTWYSAAHYCKRLGASLPSIRSASEYSFFQSVTESEGHSTSWIGGYYFEGWNWVDKSPFSYENWDSKLSFTYYRCMYLNAEKGWSNSRCYKFRPFICMKRSC